MMTLAAGLRLSVPRLDREHAEILESADEIRSVLSSPVPNPRVVEGLLAEFTRKMADHFASEEEMMQSRGYRSWRAHAREHKRLCAQLDLVRSGVATGAISPGGPLGLFVEVWTRQHIQGPDRAFAEYLHSEERAAAALQSLGS